ncbi:MAG: energy-coupling factor transporter transmembrane component T [Actinomycetota bacterium]
MRSAIAYTPRRGLLQSASPRAAIAYLGSFVVVAFLFFSPIILAAAAIGAAIAGVAAGAGRAVAAATRAGLVLTFLITVVNGLVTDRGVTVLARLGDFPLLGQVNVTAEALTNGAAIGLRIVAAMIACAVYSACVDPDRVLRMLRPVAGRSALTATLISRLVPVALGDASRLNEAARLRGPAAAPVGRGAFARRLLAGSLDRAVDVAATLELRGYGMDVPAGEGARDRSRHDRRFLVAGIALALAAIVATIAGAASFDTYPEIEVSTGPGTLALAAVTVGAGFAPLRLRRRRGVTVRHLPGGARA